MASPPPPPSYREALTRPPPGDPNSLTFEKVVAALPPSAASYPAAAFNGKDWGAVDLFNSFLFEPNGLSQGIGRKERRRPRRNRSKKGRRIEGRGKRNQN